MPPALTNFSSRASLLFSLLSQSEIDNDKYLVAPIEGSVPTADLASFSRARQACERSVEVLFVGVILTVGFSMPSTQIMSNCEMQ